MVIMRMEMVQQSTVPEMDLQKKDVLLRTENEKFLFIFCFPN